MEAGEGAEDELPDGVGAAGDVPAHVVGVAVLPAVGPDDVAGEDPVAEPGANRSIRASIREEKSIDEAWGTWA
jgi:hypothetical protein